MSKRRTPPSPEATALVEIIEAAWAEHPLADLQTVMEIIWERACRDPRTAPLMRIAAAEDDPTTIKNDTTH
jgi:hypothetical protein